MAQQDNFYPYYGHPGLGIREQDPKGIYHYAITNFSGCGVDNWSKPPAQSPDSFVNLLNVQPITTGTLQRRWGYGLLGSYNTNNLVQRGFEYQDNNLNRRLIWTGGTAVVLATNEDGTIYNPTITAASSNETGAIRCVVSRSYAYFATNPYVKWNGASVGGTSNWGLVAPNGAVTIGTLGAGSITISVGRQYFAVGYNSTTGHTSNLTPVSASTGPLTNQQVPLSFADSADAQSDQTLLLATADGGDQTLLYQLAFVNRGVNTYTDNTPEATLLAANIWQENDTSGNAFGVADNTPPPSGGTKPIKHRGRVYLAVGHNLYFSKSIDELTTSTGTITGHYEEAWPADHFLDISDSAETIKGLLSYADALYIFTERIVRRVIGSGPSDFEEPEILFNDLGLLSQDTIKLVFVEGQPIGAMWLTPDFRVVGSDFNSYKDIGTPVQGTLKNINPAAVANIQAMFVANNVYDLYILAIPTGNNTYCDTLLVFDLRAQRWFIWQPTDLVLGMLYNVNASGTPQPIIITNPLGNPTTFYKFGTQYSQDRVGNTPVNFPVTAQTAFLNLGEPTLRKALNEIDITGDPTMRVSVVGAQTDTEFVTPVSMVFQQPLVAGPLGTLKTYLAGSPTKHRFYQFTFSVLSGNSNSFLDGYSIEVVPLHRI